MVEDVWVVGDVQGFLTTLQHVLQSVGVIDAAGDWCAGGSTLVVVGDLVDRGPDSVGVVKFLQRVQRDAARRGGRVVVLIGNHDMLMLAARRFGEPFLSTWIEAGGVLEDLEALTDTDVGWLGALPALVVERGVVFMHADAMLYLEYGGSVGEVNAAFRRVLEGDDTGAWQRLLEQFGEHRAFSGPDGEANVARYLTGFEVRQVIHGHTPLPRMLQAPPETVTSAYVYREGRCVNVDPGMYLGGPGFAYRVGEPPTITP
ncbi:MAG: metallophosphoesterase [Chloroflexi bacterium]|nr:metallophosphoesterase [Chloroflexota bacterium]